MGGQIQALVRAVVAEALKRANLISRRQVIVVSVAGSGAARTVTYKLHASDTSTYTAHALQDVGAMSSGDVVWLDTFAGDSLIFGRQ